MTHSLAGHGCRFLVLCSLGFALIGVRWGRAVGGWRLGFGFLHLVRILLNCEKNNMVGFECKRNPSKIEKIEHPK